MAMHVFLLVLISLAQAGKYKRVGIAIASTVDTARRHIIAGVMTARIEQLRLRRRGNSSS
jgi:hypothetical protein